MATEKEPRRSGSRLRLTVFVLEDVEDGEDLSVVGHQGLSHQLGRHHQVLQDLQGGADHLAVPGVQGVCRGKQRRRGQVLINTIEKTGLVSANHFNTSVIAAKIARKKVLKTVELCLYFIYS